MKRILAILTIALSCSCTAKVKNYKVEVVNEYPHDTKAYTQGLFFNNGVFYESTGQFGESSFRIVDLESGKIQRKLDFSRKYFGEGSVIMGDRMYMLTWTNNVAFVYDAETLESSRPIPTRGRAGDSPQTADSSTPPTAATESIYSTQTCSTVRP